MKTPGQAEVLISFHGLGPEYRGLLAASVCFFRREPTEREERQITDLTSATDTIFQINYREEVEQAKQRFVAWLDRGLVKALEMWRAGL